MAGGVCPIRELQQHDRRGRLVNSVWRYSNLPCRNQQPWRLHHHHGYFVNVRPIHRAYSVRLGHGQQSLHSILFRISFGYDQRTHGNPASQSLMFAGSERHNVRRCYFQRGPKLQHRDLRRQRSCEWFLRHVQRAIRFNANERMHRRRIVHRSGWPSNGYGNRKYQLLRSGCNLAAQDSWNGAG